jgi:hypothetical protein
LGKSFYKKMEIDESYFERKHGKLAHEKNLSPKIFPTSRLGDLSSSISCNVENNSSRGRGHLRFFVACPPTFSRD